MDRTFLMRKVEAQPLTLGFDAGTFFLPELEQFTKELVLDDLWFHQDETVLRWP